MNGDWFPRYAYISSAPPDSATALIVRAALEGAGIEVWDAARILPGEDWRAIIRQMISGDALGFIALFSRAGLAAGSSRHHEELCLAVEELRQRPPLVPWLIPVRADDCEIPCLEIGAGRTLRSLEPVDAFGASREAGLDRLVAAVARIQGDGRDAGLRKPAASRLRPAAGRRFPAARVTGLLIGLAAGLTAAAAHSGWREPGVPEYFQTGPRAGMQVLPSASPNCGDAASSVLVSPADHVFSDVSEIRALSVGGRSAFLMEGYFGDTAYDWVVSEPDGKYGGMQLRWRTAGGEVHYCTVSITNQSPSALAQQGVRLISSTAVPATVNGQPVSFQACVWYTVRQGVIPSACWPPQ